MRLFKSLWLAYEDASFNVRLRILARYLACPYGPLVKKLPVQGRILDVGCGHGLLGFILTKHSKGSDYSYVGIDHDEHKITIANAARIRNATFVTKYLSNIESETFDCVAIVDVLYCVPLEDWPEFLERCIGVLRPGGSLIIKETIYTNYWRTLVLRLEEWFAIQIFKITKGSMAHFESIATYSDYIESASARVTRVERLGFVYPHPHCLIMATKY